VAAVAFTSFDFQSEHGEEVSTDGNCKSTRPNDIVQSLFVKSKRGFCLWLLDSFADAGVPIHEEPEISSMLSL